MEKRKYEKLFYKFQPEYLTTTVGGEKMSDRSPQASFRGGCQIPGARYNASFRLMKEPCLLDPFPHKHMEDEYLIFGTETMNGKDWDAEIEITIGLGDEAETFVIDRPATVFIPAGTWHCPLNFKRIGKPVYFQPASMQPMFGGVYKLPNGEKEMYFNGRIQCVLEPEKQCNACRRCLGMDWQDA